MRVLPALVTLALLATARGGPISSKWDDDSSNCARRCIASQKFKYAPGTTYEFEYTTETSTSMEQASEDTARLSISATALVRVVSDCDMVLKLRDVRIQESEPETGRMREAPNSRRVAYILEANTLRFSFQDGVVEEICPTEDDALWSLNVKRGVLSAFQNSMSRLDSDQQVSETDVSGKCSSQYNVQEKGWYSTVVKRSKDLTACSSRNNDFTGLQSSPFVESPVKSLPLMKSTHECQQTVDNNGILSSAVCSENHLFRPFSRETSGAVTKVSQSLKYKTQNRANVDIQPVTRRSSLVYEHASREEIALEAQQEVEELLRQLCANTNTDIRPDTPKVFSSLVSAVRKIDTFGLKEIYGKIQAICPTNIRTKKFFVDALPMAGTEGAVVLMTQLLTNDDVTGLEADMWMTSLSLVNTPTSGMLDAASSLLKKSSLQDKAMLPISTMVNSYCRNHDDCNTNVAVRNIITALEDFVGSSCYVNNKNIDQVLLAVRAIGNAGHVTSAADTLNKCVGRNRNPMEVRVTAAQAFRRMPCEANRNSVKSTFEDKSEDSELRIAAYLALMTCPDDVTLQHVQRVLDGETDQQVGSFVWSHLSNLQETSSPAKQAVRKMLKGVKLPKDFDLARLQFSRNYEASTFLQRLNSGAGLENNLIWSSSSSLPRSLSTNITMDLFGKSFNLVDAGIRLEGLEYLLETMLGPYGYFGDAKKIDRSKLDELKGSLYMRLLGNEVAFKRFEGLDSITGATNFNMLDFLIQLSKDHDISLTHSAEFLDTEMTVPTTSGLPLKLKVKGTTSVDLKASGKMDLRKVSASPRSLVIDGEIRPSGAVRVEGEMSVDALVSRAALLVTGTLHSSTVLKGRVDLDRGRVLSVEMDVPQDKMEIFDLSSEFAIVHNTVEKKQKMITEGRRTMKICSGDLGAVITGLELCGELTYPNASKTTTGPYFPLTGPTSLTVALHKRDSHTSYKLLAKRVENKKTTVAQLSFNTPGSKVGRSIAFDLVMNHQDKEVEITAASPWKKAEFKGAVTTTDNLMGVRGSFITDDVNTYALTSEVKMDQGKDGMTFTPLFELRRPNKDNVALTGLVTYDDMKSATADLTLSGLTHTPWTFKSAMTNNKREMSLQSSVANGDRNEYSFRVGTQMNIVDNKDKNYKLQIDPFLSVKTPRSEPVHVDASFLYNEGSVLKGDLKASLLDFKPVDASLTVSASERKSMNLFQGKASLNSAILVSKVDATVSVKQGRLLSGRATVNYNVPRTLKDKIVFTAKLSDRSTKAYNKYMVRTTMDSKGFPDYNNALKMNFDHKKKLTSGELELKYGSDFKNKNKQVLLSANVIRKIKNMQNMDLNYKMEAKAPEHNIDVSMKGKHSHSPSRLDSNVALSCGKGNDMSADLTLRDKSDKLTKVNGALTLQGFGSGIVLKSDLNQPNKKQWEHNVQLMAGKSKHSLSTVYENKGKKAGQVSTTLDIDGLRPIALTADTNMDWEDLKLATSAKYGKTEYGVAATQKLVKSRSGKWALEVVVPSRKVTVGLGASKGTDAFDTSLEVAWDADSDKSAKVSMDAGVSNKVSQDMSSRSARFSVNTPVNGWETNSVSLALDSTPAQHMLSTKVVMGTKSDIISGSATLATPVTPRNLDLTVKAETPFRGYQNVEMALNHKIADALNTKLTMTVQKDSCTISLSANNRGTDYSRDLQADLDLKSTLDWMRMHTLRVSASHQDDGRQFRNNVQVKVNRDDYSYVMNADVSRGTCNGDVTFAWPQNQMKTTWALRQSATDMTSSLTSTWGANQRVQVDFTGLHSDGSLGGSFVLQTPWAVAREWRADVSNDYGMGRIVSSSAITHEGRDAFRHSLTSSVDASKADLDFSMTSAWSEPISSKINARYASFPVSGNAEFSWDARKKMTAEGSAILNNWDDLDLSLRATSPFRVMRSVAAQMTHKSEGTELVGLMTLDLGLRKNLELSTRLQRDASAARVKVTSPWDELKAVETGYEISVTPVAGRVKVDFKAAPLTGQYDSVTVWNMDGDANARFRLDTPHSEFPYLQVVASCKDKRNVRQSRVELEFAPRQSYSVETTHSLDLPVVMDINVATPLSGYETMGASFRHNMRESAMDTSALVSKGDKSMKATAMLDWSRGLDSSLTLTTPFSGWEQSSATLRHEGDVTEFHTLADVTVAGQSVTGNLKAVNKDKTDVTLTLTTPVQGWEKMEAAISRKGDLNNLRATATVMYGQQKMDAAVQSKWNNRRARLMASLATPYTQDFKVTVEQNDNVEASVSYGNSYKVDATATGTYNEREVSGSGNLKYKLGGERHEVAASMAQTGSMEDTLALTAAASYDRSEISMTTSLSTYADIKANMALRTPFLDYETLGASFRSSGDLVAMTTEAEVEYMAGKRVQLRQELSFLGPQQISWRGSLNSPIRGFESTEASLNHASGPKRCAGNLHLQTSVGSFGTFDFTYQNHGDYNKGLKSETKAIYNGESLLDASLTHEMAYRRMQTTGRLATIILPELTLDIQHSGDLSRFNTNVKATAGSDKVTSDTAFTFYKDFDFSQTLTSMLKGDSNTASLAVSKVTSAGEITATFAGNLNARKANVVGKMSNKGDVTGSVEVMTPFTGFEQMGASIQTTDDTMTSAAYLQKNRVTATAKLQNSVASVDVTTPFTGFTQLGASLDMQQGLSDVSVVAKGNVESTKMEIAGNFNNARDVIGTLDIMTPFRGYSKMGSSFNLTPDLRDLTFDALAFLEDQKVEAKAKLALNMEMSGSLEITTPFSGMEQMGASFQQRGDVSDMSMQMSANLLRNAVQATATLNTNNQVSGSLDINTPFDGFRLVGGSFKHTGDMNRFNCEGRLTYMDNQDISGKVSFYNYYLQRLEVSGELKTPFAMWEETKVSYTHAGTPTKFECNAKLTCARGNEVNAVLKVDVTADQSVMLTLNTPFKTYRTVSLTHSLSSNDVSTQWFVVAAADAERVSSQLTVSAQQGQRLSVNYELQTPFTHDLTFNFDRQGELETALTDRMNLKYGENFYNYDSSLTINDAPVWKLASRHSYNWFGYSASSSMLLRREGLWNDVILGARREMDGQDMDLEVTFKNEMSRLLSTIKLTTPFVGFTDIGASFQHVGDLSSAFNTEVRVEYMDDQEIMAKLDLLRATWRRLEVTTLLTTPFAGLERSQAEYKHSASQDGFTCYAAAQYLGDQRLTGDLRVTSSPNPEMTLTINTPFYNWEQMSASGSYIDDGWGKKDLNSKIDLGRGFVYTLTSALNGRDNAHDFSAHVNTPHADWTNLETRLSHECGSGSFKGSAYLATPLLDAVSATTALRYASPFDMSASATLDTPFRMVKDWKMEMANTERGSQKNSHALVGWAGNQEVIVDATWRHDNSWYERHLHGDISVSSPFEVLRRTNWVVEHHATQGKFEQKMTGSLNGAKLIDFDVATVNSDLPEVTLTLREPYAMLYSASRTTQGADLTLDWNRNDPSSNIRLTSRFLNNSDSSNTQHDLEIKAVHPSRTVGLTYNLASNSQHTASQGELFWGRGDSRVTYVLDLSDLSRRSSNSYEGKMKVGVMSRALQLAGSVSRSSVSRQMDAAFSWDADRDANKQVALKTSWTSGDKNKIDVTLSLPSISQELRVQSEVAVNQGKTLLDATTALSYSNDASKVLTLSSKLSDTTGLFDNGSNYTLSLTLTHPHTDLEVSMTSHLGASNDRYSAAVDTTYLTTRRQRKNMALRGEIDQLRRQISMEMVSPLKKMSMKGEMKSVEPYSLTLTNKFDDDSVITADVTLDTDKRAVSLKTNYDSEHPERQMVLKAYYVNDTAVRAELYRDHVTEVITDALMALRLNTSTLLHSRLHWRTQSLGDLQQYAIQKITEYAISTKNTVNTVNNAVRDEVAARYARTTQSLAGDIQPLMQLLQEEMSQVSIQLRHAQRQLNRFYRNQPMLQSLGDAATQRIMALQNHLGQLADQSQQAVSEMSQNMKTAVMTMTQYPVGQQYQQAVDSAIQAFENAVDNGVNKLTEVVVSLDSYLLALRHRTIQLSNHVSERAYNLTSPHIQTIKDSMDFTPYISAAANKISSLRMPEQYTSAMYGMRERANQAFADVMNMAAMQHIANAGNNVYQEGVWAYKYWQVEENLKKHMESIVSLTKEIVQEEMLMFKPHFRFIQDSHVTVWDLENGEIQAEMHLPLPMETLTSLPDVTPIVDQYNQAVDNYVPDMDMDTVRYFYDNYVPQSAWWGDNETAVEDDGKDTQVVMADLKDYSPAKRARKLYSQKYNKAPRVTAI